MADSSLRSLERATRGYWCRIEGHDLVLLDDSRQPAGAGDWELVLASSAQEAGDRYVALLRDSGELHTRHVVQVSVREDA